MTSTDGKTFTIQHQFVFNSLDALIYHHFPALFYLTALVAHFPTFLFGVLCDANGSMRSNKLSRSKPISSSFPREQVVRTVNSFE
jgi:hypothetical protein